MSRFTDEKYEEYKMLIRRMKQLEPRITITKMAMQLKVDYRVVMRLNKKIERERVEAIKRALADDDLSEIIEFIKEASPEIKGIIFSQFAKPAEKIAAFRAVIEGQDRAMNLKMDAGIYQRNLGKLDVERKLNSEDEALLKKALQFATERARLGQGEQEQGATTGTRKK